MLTQVENASHLVAHLILQVQFQFVLLADTVYSPLPVEFQAYGSQQQQQQLSAIARRQKSVVAVEVQDQKNGATHYWSMSKFR